MSEDRGFLGDTWAFTKSVGSGAWNAGAGMVEGVKGLAKGGYKLATDAEAREKAWETTKELAEAAKNYGGAVYDDPGKAYRDARDGTLAAIDKFEKARDLAETEGRLAEFYGEITGAGIFEIATAVVPVGALAKAGRLGKVVNAADDVADMAKVIRKVENAEDVLSSGQKAKRVVGKSVIIEPDTKSSSIAKCSLDEGVVGVKNTNPRRKKYPNAKDIELDSKGRFRDKNGNLRTNAGPNAPEFSKWKDNGGSVKYDEATDTIIYGKSEMQTSSKGQVDVEVPYKNGPPDGKRYPDFSDYSKETVDISNMKGVTEKDISLPENGDFSKAWDETAKKHGDEYVSETYGINRRKTGSRKGTWPDKSPRGHTWHHNGNQQKMELVDAEIHKTFTHAGGASASR